MVSQAEKLCSAAEFSPWIPKRSGPESTKCQLWKALDHTKKPMVKPWAGSSGSRPWWAQGACSCWTPGVTRAPSPTRTRVLVTLFQIQTLPWSHPVSCFLRVPLDCVQNVAHTFNTRGKHCACGRTLELLRHLILTLSVSARPLLSHFPKLLFGFLLNGCATVYVNTPV